MATNQGVVGSIPASRTRNSYDKLPKDVFGQFFIARHLFIARHACLLDTFPPARRAAVAITPHFVGAACSADVSSAASALRRLGRAVPERRRGAEDFIDLLEAHRLDQVMVESGLECQLAVPLLPPANDGDQQRHLAKRQAAHGARQVVADMPATLGIPGRVVE